jgi:hypothetical protein
LQDTEVSNINPPVVSKILSNQIIADHQNLQRNITRSLASTQIGNLGNSMVDEMRLPMFKGDGSKDLDKYWFLCEVIWNIKNITNEAVKRNQFSTTLRDHALS